MLTNGWHIENYIIAPGIGLIHSGGREKWRHSYLSMTD